MQLKPFQREDYARLALHDGAILAHDTGLGKTWAAFLWPLLKVGFDRFGSVILPRGSVLIVAPGDLHLQIRQEAAQVFGLPVTAIESQGDFLRLARWSEGLRAPAVPAGFYLTSYTQLGSNGVETLGADSPFSGGIGEERNGIRCLYQPTLSDLCRDTFDCVVVDEGVRIKGLDTQIGLGVRNLNPKYRLVLTATPIKNRLPDIFLLAWWAAGGSDRPTARWPYKGDSESIQTFAREHLLIERNLTKERNELAVTGRRRRFQKLTAQVCNLHRLWKLFGPIVLRRRKEDIGEQIVKKNRHIVRVPLGVHQAETYKYHLEARYEDKDGNPAPGAKLQALRVVAADPTSDLLHTVLNSNGRAYRSLNPFTPKLWSVLELIATILARREQVIVFGALRSILDRLSTCLSEADVPHLLLDGRNSQAERGWQVDHFKLGPEDSPYPVMLAGVECMSEGHSIPLCRNVILAAYSWAFDKFEQAINRVHRINSPRDINLYSVICAGSVDLKLENSISEKSDSSHLVLDGSLLEEPEEQTNLFELVRLAREDFAAHGSGRIAEESLAAKWPEMRRRLSLGALCWVNRLDHSDLLGSLSESVEVCERRVLPAIKCNENAIACASA